MVGWDGWLAEPEAESEAGRNMKAGHSQREAEGRRERQEERSVAGLWLRQAGKLGWQSGRQAELW